jgi:elongation factor G
VRDQSRWSLLVAFAERKAMTAFYCEITMTLQRRNIGIVAHVDAGKTTLTERILFNTGRIHRVGDVHSGNTAMDFRPIEQRHGITVSAAATSCAWNDASITIIDTPGHVDFTIEVERSLRVMDGAVVVLSAVSGVEPQSETVWRQAQRFGVPRICFINKMDQVGADFDRVVGMLTDRLAARPLVVQHPLGVEQSFRGVVDLVAMRALVWADAAAAPRVEPVPAALVDAAKAARLALVEQVVEFDDHATRRYLAAGDVFDAAELQQLIRLAVVCGAGQPVLCGSAYRNIGVQPLLDAIVAYAPAPEDRPAIEGVNPRTGARETRSASADAPTVALVSKVQMSRYGALSFVRLYAGRIARGDTLVNAASGRTERIGRLLRMHADQETEIAMAVAGDVVAVPGLKATGTGETLSDVAHPLVLSGLHCPDPVIEAVIEPRAASDHERLARALAALAREDPSLRVSVDPETGAPLVAGMGELHLLIVIETLKEDHNVEASLGAPRVAYREGLTMRGEIDHIHRKQNGGVGQYARVRLALEPLDDGASGLVFENRTTGGAVPAMFVAAVEKALAHCMSEGTLAGYPVIGLKAALLDGATHAKDSTPLAFELATRDAFKKAFAAGRPQLLEPVMQVLVTTPSDYLGAIIGDLQSRRGVVTGSSMHANVHEVAALVPLANMVSYVSTVRSLSQGRATFTMQFGHYAALPQALQAKVVAQSA